MRCQLEINEFVFLACGVLYNVVTIRDMMITGVIIGQAGRAGDRFWFEYTDAKAPRTESGGIDRNRMISM